MSNRIGLAVLLILWSTVAGARHSSGILDPRRATPGIEIELVPSVPDSNADQAKYRLRTRGLPRGVTFEIWTKDFGQQFVTVLSGFRLNEADDPVSTDDNGRSRKLADVVLDPEGAYYEDSASNG